MALIPITPVENTTNTCLTCNTTRNLVVSFTGSNPAPANGYIVKWKTASQNIYTQVVPNPTSSPVTINNVPACEDINVTVQSACGPGSSSSEVTTTVTGLGIPLRCGCGYQGTTEDLTFYIYPNVPIDFTGVQNGSTITLAYNVVDRINRFDIYNVTNSSITVSSGWAGTANYPGPWGMSNNTPSTGSIQFIYDNTKVYELRVQVGGADPNNQTNDSWNVTLGCNYIAPPPTYYYYEGTVCGGSTTDVFRSTNPSLHTMNVVVKASSPSLNNTIQCYSNITNLAIQNSNDVIDTFNNCFTCNGNAPYIPITNIYTPCVFVNTGGLASSDVYVANGVVDIAPSVILYNSSYQAITSATQIASSSGEVFNVNAFGQVTTSTNQFC